MEVMETDDSDGENSSEIDGSTMECFMCLNDIRISENSSVGGENGLTSKVKDGYRPDDGKVCLRYICHYLNINLNKVSLEKQGMDNFSVKMCIQCTSVVSRLSILYEEFEVLQMKLNHSLQELNYVMKRNSRQEDGDSVRNGTRMEEVMEQPIFTKGKKKLNGGGGENGQETLRDEIMKKCADKLKGVLPILQIPRMSPETEEFLSAKYHQNSNPTKPAKVSTGSDRKRKISNPEDNHSVASNDDGDSNSSSVNVDISDEMDNYSDTTDLSETPPVPHTSSSKRSNPRKKLNPLKAKSKLRNQSFNCTMCCPPRQIVSAASTRHQITHHLETLLSSYKDPDLSPTDFKVYCHHVVKLEALSSKPQYHEADGNPYSQCPHCIVKVADHYCLKAHLVNQHMNLLGKKITELQTSTSLEDIKTFDFKKLEEAQQWKCLECGEIFKRAGNVKQHKKICGMATHQSKQYECPVCKKIFNSSNALAYHKRSTTCRRKQFENSAGGGLYICKLCCPPRKILNEVHRVTRHQIAYHMEQLFISCKATNMSDKDFKTYCQHMFKMETLSCKPQYSETDGDPYIKCPHCYIKFAGYDTIEMHFVGQHKEILERKLVELQRDSKIDEVRNFNYAKLEQALRWECFECGETFKRARNLRNHKKTCGTAAEDEGGGCKCPACKKKFKSRDDLQSHRSTLCGKKKSSQVKTPKTQFLDAEDASNSNSSDQFSSPCVGVKTENGDNYEKDGSSLMEVNYFNDDFDTDLIL